MKNTIHLVQVNDIIDTNIILPLAIGILWQYSLLDSEVESKWQLGQIVYRPLEADQDVKKLAQGHMVVFSNYTWNYSYHIRLAQQIKKINPAITVVFGGPQISSNLENFWQQNADIVDLAILGEGEHVFTQVLKTWPALTCVPGMWTADYCQGNAPRVQDFPYPASPYLSGFYDNIVRVEQSRGNMIQAVIQTNRGCPYHCTFCEEGKEYKNKMFFYDYTRIHDEIAWCADKQVEYLTIGDDNWGIVDQDVEVMRWITEAKSTCGYPNIVDATYAKNNPENLLAMARLDQEKNTQLIRGITVAVQSMNNQTLSSIKRFNLIPEKQQQLIAGLKKIQVPTYCEMIWPLPFDTYESFCAGIDQTIAIGLDNWLGVYPLSLTNGTELYEQYSKDYTVIYQHSENNHVDVNSQAVAIATANRWVDTDTVIQGQVLYGWLVCLYYFGFARKSLGNLPVTATVNQFISWIENNPHTNTFLLHNKFKTWWQQYLGGQIPVSLSMFDQDTTHWSPYTHLGSWLQYHWHEFYEDWNNFLLNIHNLPPHQDQQFTVRYGQIYNNFNHRQPKFDSLFEFSRYYYWWNRKKGYRRL